MLRNLNLIRLFGNLFILLIMTYMALFYYIFAYRNGIQMPDKSLAFKIHIGFFHIFISLTIISFVRVIISDPGKVPLFWGFFLDDPDHKRRRYCLICHIFKPERCHHCSACNRCVLNMDHHCPWLNNCIGFYNRKYFLLLLFYAIVLTTQIAIVYAVPFYHLISSQFGDEAHKIALRVDPDILLIGGYALNGIAIFILGSFFKFHMTLVRDNMTTIEHMDRKRGPDAKHEHINYDMGFYYNFIQIFGKNPLLWGLPFMCGSGKPVGDGVVWPQKPAENKPTEGSKEIDMVTPSKPKQYNSRESNDRGVTPFDLTLDKLPDGVIKGFYESTPNTNTAPAKKDYSSDPMYSHPTELNKGLVPSNRGYTNSNS